MARLISTHDTATLQMALVGYEVERQKIDERIREIQSQLKGKAITAAPATGDQAAPGKRVLSPAARRRIAMAQKKRWAEHRKRQAQAKAEAK
ncbi:MAG: hypothetical protein ABSH49_10105 [Bryobacteraceae bacterium]